MEPNEITIATTWENLAWALRQHRYRNADDLPLPVEPTLISAELKHVHGISMKPSARTDGKSLYSVQTTAMKNSPNLFRSIAALSCFGSPLSESSITKSH